MSALKKKSILSWEKVFWIAFAIAATIVIAGLYQAGTTEQFIKTH